MDVQSFPECRKCGDGVLLPLSDYGRDGAPITYKAWGLQQSELRFQHPHRQRRDQPRPRHRNVFEVSRRSRATRSSRRGDTP
jgi:hypothetical protein